MYPCPIALSLSRISSSSYSYISFIHSLLLSVSAFAFFYSAGLFWFIMNPPSPASSLFHALYFFLHMSPSPHRPSHPAVLCINSCALRSYYFSVLIMNLCQTPNSLPWMPFLLRFLSSSASPHTPCNDCQLLTIFPLPVSSVCLAPLPNNLQPSRCHPCISHLALLALLSLTPYLPLPASHHFFLSLTCSPA